METRNMFAVGAGNNGTVIMRMPKIMTKEEALNLIAWVAIISMNDIEDIAKALQQLESL